MCLASLSCAVEAAEEAAGGRHSTRSHQRAGTQQERLDPPEMSPVYGRNQQIQQVVLMFGGKKPFLPLLGFLS